jgi:hypothetical protein
MKRVNKKLIREVDALIDRCLVAKCGDIVNTFFNAFVLIELRRRVAPDDAMTNRLKRLVTLRATELLDGNKEAVKILRGIATDALKQTLGRAA